MKIAAGSCGCGTPETDTDSDGIADCIDTCPSAPGQIGSACNDGNVCTTNDVLTAGCICSGTFADADGDGTCDANDGCPDDPLKTAAGICGCGTPDTDTDGDGTCDAIDTCPNVPGQIGSTCNDGNACTTNDVLTAGCVCSGTFADADGDGTCDASDCAPNNPAVYPGAIELCDGLDNDCDGTIDQQAVLHFDGADDHVAVGSWFSEQNFTIEMWLKPGSTQNQYANIVDNNHAFNTRWVCQQNGSITNEYYWAVASGGSPLVHFTLQPHQWQHVALVKAPNLVAVYVNGMLAGSGATSGNINGVGSGDFVRLGQWAGGGRAWNGRMRDVRFWNSALSQAQIAAGMQQSITVPTVELLANYRMNDGVPNGTNTGITAVNDASGNARHALLNAFALTGSTSSFVGEALDMDGDGLCNTDDNCPVNAGQVGSPCDDGAPCTINDQLNSNCICSGSFQDTDGDGTCDANDCAPNDLGVFPSAMELCDGIDNNCNGLVDDVSQTITLRSGNGSIGQPDAVVRMLIGPGDASFQAAFTPADFLAARTGPAPLIINNHPAWIPSLGADASAKWVNDVGNNGGGASGLYAIDFHVNGPVISAQIDFHYAVDNLLGGSPNQGVYINGQPLSGFTEGGTYSSQSTISRNDIGPLLQPGLNTLYVNASDLGFQAGLMFSATITVISICNAPVWHADLDGDGYGDPAVELASFTQPNGYVANSTDCNDANAAINPGAQEVCDGLDNNCDGLVDQLSALDFDGVNDHIALPAASFSGPWTAITVEAWIRSDGATGDFQTIFGSSTQSFVHLQTFTGGNIAVYNDQGVVLLPILPLPSTGEWHHVALTSRSGSSVLYLDGVPIGSSQDVYSFITPPPALFIGQGFQGGRNFNGQLRDLRVWNVERSAAQVQADMSGTSAASPGLVLHMPLNDGMPGANNSTLTSTADISGNDLDGALVNFQLSGNASNWTGAPMATEICNGIDDDCDGQVDEGCGGCSPADIALMLANTQPTQACVMSCYGGQPNNVVSCITNCYVQAGFSAACATCVVQFQLCTATSCPECQTDPNSAACIQCRQAAGCDAAFMACSGLQDADGDGEFAPFDCNDNNASVNSNGMEGCVVDGLDNDCDGQVDEDALVDADNDGYTLCAGDCNDMNPDLNPAATEVCDGADNDCDGLVDEGFPVHYLDNDGDGYGDPNALGACGYIGSVPNNLDCDDTDPTVYTGAPEICDGLDNDCNGTVDDNLADDLDGDGFTPCTGDCDDQNATVFPGASELCDGLDNDCNGAIEPQLYADTDLDGYGEAGNPVPCGTPGSTNQLDCDDTDPLVTLAPLWYPDVDGDGYGVYGIPVIACTQPTGYASNSFDCEDNDAQVFPGQGCVECSPADLALMASNPGATTPSQACAISCGSAQNAQQCLSDCLSDNGLTGACAECFSAYAFCQVATCPICQEQPGSPACLACQENSGCKEAFMACSGLEDADDDGYFAPFDCNDLNAAVHPEAPELCDGADNDCDGFVDEGCDVRIAVKVMLQGPYNPGSGTMSDGMRALGLVPTTEPYAGLGYVHAGGGGETTTPAVLAVAGDDAVVDWVLIELRDAEDPSITVASRSALLQRDGDVVEVDGVSPVTMPSGPGSYHVAVVHRNHLGAMTFADIQLSSTATALDLTTAATLTYGTNARKSITGTFPTHALWAGDVNFDGTLKYVGEGNDRDPILLEVGGTVPTNTSTGYKSSDVNMDGTVKYVGDGNDRDPILLNVGGAVPTNVRAGQLPWSLAAQANRIGRGA